MQRIRIFTIILKLGKSNSGTIIFVSGRLSPCHLQIFEKKYDVQFCIDVAQNFRKKQKYSREESFEGDD